MFPFKFKFDKNKLFVYILGLSALFVASVAAFFSVMGISMLFSGAAVSAMIMATSLEIGKITATSFLYRYWKKISTFLRIYLCGAIAVLVLITSMGVFGWLTSAYQSSSIQYELMNQQVMSLVEQKESVVEQSELSNKRITEITKLRSDQEQRMNDALNNPVLSRNPTALRQVQEQSLSLIKQTDEDLRTERSNYNEFIRQTMEFDKKILEAKAESNKTKDVVTFKFVADSVGLDLNTTVKWFIVIIIAVFDPLAVALIISYNVAMLSEKRREEDRITIESGPVRFISKESTDDKPEVNVSKEEILKSVIPSAPSPAFQQQPIRQHDPLHYPQVEPKK